MELWIWWPGASMQNITHSSWQKAPDVSISVISLWDTLCNVREPLPLSTVAGLQGSAGESSCSAGLTLVIVSVHLPAGTTLTGADLDQGFPPGSIAATAHGAAPQWQALITARPHVAVADK